MTVRVEEYGFVWDVTEGLGQEGLLKENHYRPLFLEKNRESSLKNTDHWLDAGANIGAFAIRADEFVKLVVAVEPESENIACLHRNIALNQCHNIVVEEAALVGDDSTEVQLALSNSYSSTHRVGKIRGRESVTVPALNIDAVVEQYEINKIKMDIEGAEVEILEAMDLDPIDEIIFEYHFSFTKVRPWERYFDILKKIEDAGLTILRGPRVQSGTWHTIVWAKRV